MFNNPAQHLLNTLPKLHYAHALRKMAEDVMVLKQKEDSLQGGACPWTPFFPPSTPTYGYLQSPAALRSASLIIGISVKEASKKITRQAFECPLFGYPRDLVLNKLPTHEDVLKCCFQKRYNLALETNNKCVSFYKVSAIVAQKIKSVFDKALIPTVSEYRIVQLTNAYHDSYYKLRKSYNCDTNKATFKEKIENFK
uniref:Uncharacterized protein n=1 Tax=Timema bartmani TaxID=61472 RepID=A0A7R9F2V7_9NEOP|nr:unnamed protein product [Timema bartmani]